MHPPPTQNLTALREQDLVPSGLIWVRMRLCIQGLPRADRKAARADGVSNGSYSRLFSLERHAYSDESDGEPEGVPMRRTHG